MDDLDQNSLNKKRIKIPSSWVWIVATLAICAIFAFTLVPAAAAMGNNASNTATGLQTSQTRRYTSIIQNVFDFIQRHYIEETDPKVVFEGAMNGMFNALGDPYSVFMPESEMNSLNDTTQGSFGGVGLYISKPAREGRPSWVEVSSPIEGTPGWRAGINPGDLIIQINGEPTDVLTLDEVLGKLRGRPGVELELLIRRGERLEFPVKVTRAIIEVPTARHEMIGDIGYLKLLTFTPMTVGRARDAIGDFNAQKYTSLILDLRNNYGGLLTSAVDVASLFLDGGLVVRTQSRIQSENQNFYARRSILVPEDIPVIVLINKGSASASEIVAGALKDRGRAFLVGENTFGKGSVQQVFPVENAGFKLTTAHYYTPSDRNIDKIGIPPDREVSFPEITDADAVQLNELLRTDKIREFVSKNPQANAAQVEAFVRSLEREYHLDFNLLSRLVRNEQNRTVIAPVYDLEYDVQLLEAVNILRRGEYQNLLQNARVINTLQEEIRDDFPIAS